MHSRLTGALAALAIALPATCSPISAAEVTYERLLNPEPQNWLMNHHSFSAQRHSPLDIINKTNAKNLKLVFAVPIGGTSGNEHLQSTPLVEDGFMYMVDVWGVVYKIDARSGTRGQTIWKMDPGLQKPDRNRGVALWGNLIISVTGFDGRIVATNKDSGQIVWDRKYSDQPDMEFTAAPLALRDSVLIGASGGDLGVRDWIASLDPKTGEMKWKTYSIPAPGEPGSETWKDKTNNWQTGGGAFYVTGSYDPGANLTYWGSGNPVPRYDSSYRPGDNLFTDSALALDATSGKMQWYFQYTPNENMDYDETGTHIVLDVRIDGEDRKLLSHAGRNGFQYTFDRLNGRFLKAVQYVDKVTWTKGIDSKTGKPVDYDPSKDIQTYNNNVRNTTERMTNVCPDVHGGGNYWPASYSPRTKLLYLPSHEGCVDVIPDTSAHVRGKFAGGGYANINRVTGNLSVVDPATGELKLRKALPYPVNSGVLTTGGGIVVTAMLDGTILAYDDQTYEELWSINVGAGFSAPPMTYAVNGKQYIAIASGSGGIAKAKLSRSPEMKTQNQATVLWVFGL